MSEHAHYKDAAAHLARLQQLQGRGLNLVKLHVINTLKMATQSVQTQVQGTASSAEASFTLYYGRFRLHAPRIKALMAEIERRSEAGNEYAVLLKDCHNCYLTQRVALLQPVVDSAINGMGVREAGNLPSLVRSGCAYMVRAGVLRNCLGSAKDGCLQMILPLPYFLFLSLTSVFSSASRVLPSSYISKQSLPSVSLTSIIPECLAGASLQ